MRTLRTRLEQARHRTGMGWEVLERDYVLSWILAGISRHGQLRETLVFKGGTALKKCYFGDYRFSEDLDFSGLAGVPVGGDMEAAIDNVCRTATQLRANTLRCGLCGSGTPNGTLTRPARKHLPSGHNCPGSGRRRRGHWWKWLSMNPFSGLRPAER